MRETLVETGVAVEVTSLRGIYSDPDHIVARSRSLSRPGQEVNSLTIAAVPQGDVELARRSVRVRLPAWLAGGDPLDFGRMCRWRMEAAGLAAGEWDVRLDERVRRRPARLLQVNRLAGSRNADAAGAYSRLRRLPASENLYGRVPRELVQAELNRIGAQHPGDLAALMYQVTLATLSSAPGQLPDIVRQALRDHLLPVLPDAAVYLVEVDEALGKRYGAARLLRQVEDDSAMSLRPPVPRDGKPVFNAARGLSSDTSWVWRLISRRFSSRFPRGYGRCQQSGSAAWSSTHSVAR